MVTYVDRTWIPHLYVLSAQSIRFSKGLKNVEGGSSEVYTKSSLSTTSALFIGGVVLKL